MLRQQHGAGPRRTEGGVEMARAVAQRTGGRCVKVTGVLVGGAELAGTEGGGEEGVLKPQ
jgi:hypothetical protein